MVDIKILGIPESQRTLELTSRVQVALDHLKIESTITIEGDLQKLISFNLSGIPALAINNQIVFQKTIPALDDMIHTIEELIKTDRNNSQSSA